MAFMDTIESDPIIAAFLKRNIEKNKFNVMWASRIKKIVHLAAEFDVPIKLDGELDVIPDPFRRVPTLDGGMKR